MSRLTIVENIYHQNPGENPFQISDTYEQCLETEDEQPYQRTYKIGPELTDLDCGWLKECGLVHIKNKGDSEVYIACRGSEDFFKIPIGCSTKIYPTNAQGLQVFSDADQTKITVTVFPK